MQTPKDPADQKLCRNEHVLFVVTANHVPQPDITRSGKHPAAMPDERGARISRLVPADYFDERNHLVP